MKNLLHSFSNPQKAEINKRFFKTGKGEYAEHDVFIGVTVPQIRTIAKKFYKEVTSAEISSLLHSKIHEERALALMILVEKYQKTKDDKVVNFYLDQKNLHYVNNWDLVDLSCYKILGEYLLEKPDKTSILYGFAQSESIWIQRIAIVSTLAFIRKWQFEHTIRIAEMLLNDNHNLIHKATGWMLREVGKKDKDILLNFLGQHHTKIPKITLSYAVEKLTHDEKVSIKSFFITPPKNCD